jgi:hypothetical protein
MKDYFYNGIQQEMIRALEEQRRFSSMLEQAADPLREIRETLYQMHDREAAHLQLLAKDALLESAKFSIPAAMDWTIRPGALALTQSLVDEFREHTKLRLDAFEALHQPAIDAKLGAVLSYQEELVKLDKSMKLAFESIYNPAQQIQSALAALEASARLYPAPAAHWSNALSVVASYEKFAIRQTKKLDTDSPLIAERRARITELAGNLLAPSLSASEVVGSESDSATPAIDTVRPRIFGPLNSHLGYVYRVAVEVDVDLAVASAIPARICQLGGAIVFKVVRINEALKRRDKEDIFHSTNRSLWAASIIPAVVTGTERDFAEIVDALFFLLYEGSGASTCRLSSVVSDEDLQPLWRLKHLRLYYRHDIEHGSSKEIAKKHQKVGDAFVALTGRSLLSRPAEWILAQAELYQQLFDMLQKVEEAVKGENGCLS